MIKDLIEKDITINELQDRINEAIEYLKNNEVLISIIGSYYYKLLEILGDKENE